MANKILASQFGKTFVNNNICKKTLILEVEVKYVDVTQCQVIKVGIVYFRFASVHAVCCVDLDLNRSYQIV